MRCIKQTWRAIAETISRDDDRKYPRRNGQTYTGLSCRVHRMRKWSLLMASLLRSPFSTAAVSSAPTVPLSLSRAAERYSLSWRGLLQCGARRASFPDTPWFKKKIILKKMPCFWIDGCRKMGWLLARRVLSGVRAWGPPPLYHMNVTGIWWPIVGASCWNIGALSRRAQYPIPTLSSFLPPRIVRLSVCTRHSESVFRRQRLCIAALFVCRQWTLHTADLFESRLAKCLVNGAAAMIVNKSRSSCT